jgi:hypothetical protein
MVRLEVLTAVLLNEGSGFLGCDMDCLTLKMKSLGFFETSENY